MTYDIEDKILAFGGSILILILKACKSLINENFCTEFYRNK